MPSFNQKILDSFVIIFAEQTELMAEKLKDYTGYQFDIFDVLDVMSLETIRSKYTVFDIIKDCCIPSQRCTFPYMGGL